MSATYSGIDGYVGNTPLIRLRRLSELTGCEILGKAEFMNRAGRRVGFVARPCGAFGLFEVACHGRHTPP